MYTVKIDEKENNSKKIKSVPALDKRQIFLEALVIIQQMIDAVKEEKVFKHLSKMITHTSMFTLKLTDENWEYIGKGVNEVWKQVGSV